MSCFRELQPAELTWWQVSAQARLLLQGFVLVGRSLEERAKLRASADMTALQVRPAGSLVQRGVRWKGQLADAAGKQAPLTMQPLGAPEQAGTRKRILAFLLYSPREFRTL